MSKNIDNSFSVEQVLKYYNKIYGRYSDTKTDLKTVEDFLKKFGHLYQNDIDETCDLLKDYVLARHGLF